MKKRTARVIALLIAVILTMTGCGGKQASTGNESDQNHSDAKVSGELSIMCWYEEEDFKPLVDGFKEKYPDVTVELINQAGLTSDQYSQKLTLLANSGELPDIVSVEPPAKLMVDAGYLADISELEAVKKLSQKFRDGYTYDGKTYAYCPDAWVGGIFYNADIFEQYGLEVPKTFADFINICETLTDAGVAPISVYSGYLLYFAHWFHNTEVVSKDPTFDMKINTGEVTFEEGYLEAFKMFKEQLVDTGYIPQESVAMSYEQMKNDFLTGKAAMMPDGPWALDGLKEDNPEMSLGAFPLVGTDGQALSIGALNVAFAITTEAKNPTAAEAFIEYLGTAEALGLYQEMAGNFLGVDYVEYEVAPEIQSWVECSESGNFNFGNTYWEYRGTLDSIFNKGLEEIVLGTMTPEELVANLDAKQQEFLNAEK